jgi:ABC-type sugar transport system ATPase subunit
VRTSDGSLIPLPSHYAHATGELIVGLRPEHLSIRHDATFEQPAIEGVVRHVEHLGAETELYADRCGTRLCLRHFGREVPSIGARDAWLRTRATASVRQGHGAPDRGAKIRGD